MPARALGMAQPRVERDGAALGEPGQHDARGRDAAAFLALDQRLDALLGGRPSLRRQRMPPRVFWQVTSR
jgi:hypothetical protein